jgi:DNA-binding MarR family transcriptional regulator
MGADGQLDLSGVTRWLGFMLRIAQVRMFQRYYEAEIGKEISPGVLSSLTVIRDNPGVRHGVLADALLIRRPNMTKLVESMVRAGLVSRRSLSGDGRSVALFVTPKGSRVLARAHAMNRDLDEASAATLNAAERAELQRLLRKLAGLPAEAGPDYNSIVE